MTTLAQTFLENREGLTSKWDYWVCAKLGYLFEDIRPDWIKTFGHDGQMPKISQMDADAVAQRYVFSQCLDALYEEATQALRLTNNLIFESVKMLERPVWIEWTAPENNRYKDTLKIGVLFDARGEEESPGATPGLNLGAKSQIAVACIAGDDRRAGVYHIGSIEELPFPVGQKKYVRLGWSSFGTTKEKKDAQLDFTYVLTVALYGLFLIQQPRVVEVVDVKHGLKLQKARQKRGKLELIEYNKVNVLIGGKSKQYRGTKSNSNPSSADEIAKMKYHWVDPHWRTYHRGTEKQRVIWIDEYTRGDPALGVIFKEKHMKVEK